MRMRHIHNLVELLKVNSFCYQNIGESEPVMSDISSWDEPSRHRKYQETYLLQTVLIHTRHQECNNAQPNSNIISDQPAFGFIDF